LQAALERELADTEAKLATEKAEPTASADGDSEMAGIEAPEPASKEDEEGSEAGSEDLEAESSGSEEEDEEEDGEGEGEGDEDMEMGDGEGEEKPAEDATTNGEQKPVQHQGNPEVMVH
jgi:histone chaperone ASF1